jgi:LacI family transcriptional regulator
MRRLPGLKASLVAPENKDGARKATAHLVGAGHKRIAFVGGAMSMVVRDERLAGYRRALEEAGIPFDASLVIETMITYSGGAGAVPQLLNLPEPATAALCYNDVVAIGLLRAFAAAGVVVGKEFAVIGFDDIDEAKHTFPALTSVAVNGRNLGSRAAQLLMRQLASGKFEPETVLCPATLVIRSSCGTALTNETGAHP